MPELPEIEALADHLRRNAVGATVQRVDVASLSALKTFDPPVSALHGRTVDAAHRWGKFLGVQAGDLYLVTHLSRAGWLRWSDSLSPAPLKPGKGPIALRVHLADADAAGPPATGAGFDLTEAGTQKRLAVWLVSDPSAVPGIATLGPDALAVSPAQFAALLAANNGRIKTVITDQSVLAGIGNAYSDEILHVAHLSPFTPCKSLTAASISALHDAIDATLRDAIARSAGQKPALLKSEKRAGMRVHGRAGEPCPVCNDTVREVSFADSALQYCPTCQTGGKLLADRRLSKFIK